MLFVPGQRFAQTVAHIPRRPVAEKTSRLADVGLRMPDVAGAELGVNAARETRVRMPLCDQIAQAPREVH